MTTVQFYRRALLAPMLLPLVFLPFGIGGLFAIIMAFGGAQYFVFAVTLYFVVGRLKTPERIQRLARWSPLLFIPVQATGWLISFFVERQSNPELEGMWDPLPIFAAYVLIVGYACVGVVAIAYRIAKARGYIEPLAIEH